MAQQPGEFWKLYMAVVGSSESAACSTISQVAVQLNPGNRAMWFIACAATVAASTGWTCQCTRATRTFGRNWCRPSRDRSPLEESTSIPTRLSLRRSVCHAPHRDTSSVHGHRVWTVLVRHLKRPRVTAREQVLVTDMQEVPFCCSPSQRGHSDCSPLVLLSVCPLRFSGLWRSSCRWSVRRPWMPLGAPWLPHWLGEKNSTVLSFWLRVLFLTAA